MKKILMALSLVLALCLLCGAAMAEEEAASTHPSHLAEDGTIIFEHNYDTDNFDDSNIVNAAGMCGSGTLGRIRFLCTYEGYDYTETDEVDKTSVIEGMDVKEFAIYPYEKHDFPKPGDDDFQDLLVKDSKGNDIYKAPSCSSTGYYEVYCRHCAAANGDKKVIKDDNGVFRWTGCTKTSGRITLPKTGHQYADDAGLDPSNKVYFTLIQEATCQQEGKLNPVCIYCKTPKLTASGELFLIITEKLDHKLEYSTETFAGNCNKKSFEKVTAKCTNEGCDYEEVISYVEGDYNPEVHDWGPWHNTSAATCTKEGEQMRVCKKHTGAEAENAKELRKIPALGHYLVFGKMTKEPNCTETGEMQLKCSECTEFVLNVTYDNIEDKIEEIKAQIRNYDELDINAWKEKMAVNGVHPTEYWKLLEDQSKAPTCEMGTEDDPDKGLGYNKYQCKLCDTVFTEKLDRIAHTFPARGTKVPVTCAEDGYTKKVCDVCHYEWRYDIVACTGHLWSDWHYGWDDADEDDEALGYWYRNCMRCGQHDEFTGKKEDLPAKDDCQHLHIEHKNAIAPTCGEAGYEEGDWCKDCETYIAGGKVIPATGDHDYSKEIGRTAATCKTPAIVTLQCTKCEGTTVQYEGSVLPHSYTVIVEVKEATYDAPKTIVKKCATCDETITVTEGEPIARPNPQDTYDVDEKPTINEETGAVEGYATLGDDSGEVDADMVWARITLFYAGNRCRTQMSPVVADKNNPGQYQYKTQFMAAEESVLYVSVEILTEFSLVPSPEIQIGGNVWSK